MNVKYKPYLIQLLKLFIIDLGDNFHTEKSLYSFIARNTYFSTHLVYRYILIFLLVSWAAKNNS